MRTHRDLDVWKEGIDLVLAIYKILGTFPKEERYALSDQIKRAATSVPSNIAEGAARNGRKEFVQFLYIALGSLAELETQLIIAEKLHYLADTEIFALIEREKSKLLGLIRNLKDRETCPPPGSRQT